MFGLQQEFGVQQENGTKSSKMGQKRGGCGHSQFQNRNLDNHETRSHLVFLLEQVADVFELVPIHWLEVLRGVTHRDHPVWDVGEVEVVPVLNEPPLLLRHECLDRVGHSHLPHLTLLDTMKIETRRKSRNWKVIKCVMLFVVGDFKYLVSVGPSHVDHPPRFSLTITRS